MREAIHIIGGGTVFHVRPHLALSAPAYGWTAREISRLCNEGSVRDRVSGLTDKSAPAYRDVHLHLTRMAGGGECETNEDVRKLLAHLIEDPRTKMIYLPAALCDFEGAIFGDGGRTPSGKDQPRLSSQTAPTIGLSPAEKLIGMIRKTRKDIFLVGFKTTAGATEDEQYLAGLTLLKTTSCNLVFANDLHNKRCMIVAPELARYSITTDRRAALLELVQMADARSRLSFLRTTVKQGNLIPWDSDRVPPALRTVVDWCAEHGAYKPFRDVTVGHFAFCEAPGVLISSRRKQNYNRRECRDLVRVEFLGDEMFAYGAKPSAGTRSQYAVLSKFPENDCIVHFHCPLLPGSKIVVRSQKDLECGSHECGENTWKGMMRFGNLAAVMLDQHGPNIIFHRTIDPNEVIEFIGLNFDLSKRSDGI